MFGRKLVISELSDEGVRAAFGRKLDQPWLSLLALQSTPLRFTKAKLPMCAAFCSGTD